MSVLQCIVNAGLNYLLYTVINDVLHPRQGCMGNWNIYLEELHHAMQIYIREFFRRTYSISFTQWNDNRDSEGQRFSRKELFWMILYDKIYISASNYALL